MDDHARALSLLPSKMVRESLSLGSRVVSFGVYVIRDPRNKSGEN